MGILSRCMLVKTDVDDNNNKFWEVEIHDDFSVHVRNGRIGGKGQNQPVKHFGSELKATQYVESKKRAKIRGDYQEFTGSGPGSAPNRAPMNRMALEMAASQQIRTNSQDVVSALITVLVQANVHSILKSTDLKYDEDTGVFQTPLGIVTEDSINDARAILIRISKHIAGDDFSSDEMKKLVASYLMLIPQKVGRKLDIKALLPDQEALEKQNGILDDLLSSITQVEALNKQEAQKSETAIEVEKIFSCSIDLVEDPAICRQIHEFYAATRKRMHDSYKYRIKRIFSVDIDGMNEAYDRDGKNIGNSQLLWHGSRPGNILSILKSGLVVPPSNAAHCCGRMFGNGAYFSDQSTKSLNYATGWWHGAKEGLCFMFLADVAMGKAYTPKSSSESLPKNGFDSTFAKAGESGVHNNEMIVYRTSQSRIRYLVEFEA